MVSWPYLNANRRQTSQMNTRATDTADCFKKTSTKIMNTILRHENEISGIGMLRLFFKPVIFLSRNQPFPKLLMMIIVIYLFSNLPFGNEVFQQVSTYPGSCPNNNCRTISLHTCSTQPPNGSTKKSPQQRSMERQKENNSSTKRIWCGYGDSSNKLLLEPTQRDPSLYDLTWEGAACIMKRRVHEHSQNTTG